MSKKMLKIAFIFYLFKINRLFELQKNSKTGGKQDYVNELVLHFIFKKVLIPFCKFVYDYSRPNWSIRKNFLLLKKDHCKKTAYLYL